MKLPYTFETWLKDTGNINSDIPPEILYDGYVASLESQDYIVHGDCYDGIYIA